MEMSETTKQAKPFWSAVICDAIEIIAAPFTEGKLVISC